MATNPSLRLHQLFGTLDPTEQLVWSSFAESWGTGKNAACTNMILRFNWSNRAVVAEMMRLFGASPDFDVQWFDPSDDAPEVITAEATDANEIDPSGIKVQINDYRREMTVGQAHRLSDRLRQAVTIARDLNSKYNHEDD